jgi:long-chain acyl-CoA synthetase
VIGDQKPFVAALISLDAEMLPIWLGNNGLDKGLTLAQAAKEPKVLAEIQAAVDRVNKHFSRAESIRKFTVIGQDLSEESGHLTPSLKIKREVVLRDFAPAVEEIYQSGPETGEITS